MPIDDFRFEIDRSRSSMGECEDILASLRARLGECRKELDIRTRPAPQPKVSSHAVLRYLERVKGMDIEAIEKEMLD
jgi:hypothetical protein